MNLRTKVTVLLLFTLGYFWLCHYVYTCLLRPVCYDCGQQAVASVEEENVATPAIAGLRSDWSSETVSTANLDDFKSSTLLGAEEEDLMEIIGFYHADEANSSTYANLGLARAANIRALFSSVPDDKIRMSSRLLEEEDGVRTQEFLSGEINWITPISNNVAVEELSDRAIIRFPFNSVEKEFEPAIDDYLDRLAGELKLSNKKVVLTGHTDNVGDESKNYELALRRAKMIRDILRKKGVKRSRITTESEGQSDPVATNATEEGRRQNRRVEVRIR